MKSVLIGILIGAITCGVVYFTILDKPIPEPEIKTVVDTIYTKVIERDTIWEIMQPDIVFDTVFVEISTPSIETDVWEDSELVFEEEWVWTDTTIFGDNYEIDLTVVYSYLWEDFEITADVEVISELVFVERFQTVPKPVKKLSPIVSVGGLYHKKSFDGFYLGGGLRFWERLDTIVGYNTDEKMILNLNWKF